ncbi:MAG TPA: carboxypeptidase-like regulatory domain-containing protein, partial [Terriglobales bacterium]|nr:carboxypeptidase-like regulatory domain-containing protein [Terriglobales bacterium]
MKRCLFGVSLLLVFAFLCSLPAAADNLYASIKGTATDPSGAVVSGVKLTAVNTATGISYTATSS